MMYRGSGESLEVLLAHPGGPFFRNKDDGAWSIPKGLMNDQEAPREAALREFGEEIGLAVEEPLIPLGTIVQRGGKTVHAWAFRGTAPSGFSPKSNSFEIEWPPRSGKRQSFPEIDRAEFFGVSQALRKINPAQVPFIERLLAALTQ